MLKTQLCVTFAVVSGVYITSDFLRKMKVTHLVSPSLRIQAISVYKCTECMG